ncbi:MAG: hypothetical protein HDP34_03590 [Clostridia bacterium]|nr:hypothetical protein [Clostridia bacterium]
MEQNFEKFKKRIWLDIIIKCVCFALAAGLVAVSVVLLPCKLCGVKLLWVYYLLIGLGGVALGGGISFLCLKTNDRDIARRLDSELKLQERVETAYVFNGQKSDMLDLQRADAIEALGGISASSLAFKHIVATALAAAIAVAGVVAIPVIACVVTPVSAEEEQPEVDLPREVTDWEWAALDDLIEEVKNSRRADSYTKTGIVTELESLRVVLLGGVSTSGLKMFVESTVTNVRNVVTDANGRAGVSEEQQAGNSEEGNYVINQLYAIFSLQRPGGADDENGPGTNPDEEENGETDPGTVGGKPEENLSKVPFFDPELGYVTISEAREIYYERVQAAFDEGTISREEWEYIITTYFADLMNKD